MIGTILAHYRGVRKLSGGGMCILCEAQYLRLGLRAAHTLMPENLDSDVKSGNRFCLSIPRCEAALSRP